MNDAFSHTFAASASDALTAGSLQEAQPCAAGNSPEAAGAVESEAAAFGAASASSTADQELVAWVSLNPRIRGEQHEPSLDWYSCEVARKIEKAYWCGEASVQLGFHDAAVYFGDKLEQRTSTGRRDVQRVTTISPSAEVILHYARGRRSWQFTAPGADGSRELRRVVPRDCLVNPEDCCRPTGSKGSQAAVEADDTEQADDAERATTAVSPLQEEQEQAETEGDPLWEWCHSVAARAGDLLHAHAWGEYGAETNLLIEQAFQAGSDRVDVIVGVREYSVVFGPEHGFALQEDPRLKKRRLVRRRLACRAALGGASQPADMASALPVSFSGQETCVLCSEEFSATPAMPILELPDCHHVFHQACAQPLGDQGSACPCCRRAVDWASLSSSRRHTAGRQRRRNA